MRPSTLPLRHVGLCALALVTAACSRSTPERGAAPSLDTPAVVPTGASLGAHAPTPAAPRHELGYVVTAALVRRMPNESREWLPPQSKRKQLNGFTTLYRGEQVRVVGATDGFYEVILSDESRGFVKTAALLVQPQVRVATLLRACRSFTRPDLLAVQGGRVLEPGVLLFVLREKDAFSEVQDGGAKTSWVLTDTLVDDAQEVNAAKLIDRARLLQKRDDPQAGPILELLRASFHTTQLMQLFEAAHAPPAPEAGVEPSSQAPRPLPLTLPVSPEPARAGGAPGLQDLPTPQSVPQPDESPELYPSDP